MIEQCPQCQGNKDYPMLVSHRPRGICADPFHKEWIEKAFSKQEVKSRFNYQPLFIFLLIVLLGIQLILNKRTEPRRYQLHLQLNTLSSHIDCIPQGDKSFSCAVESQIQPDVVEEQK